MQLISLRSQRYIFLVFFLILAFISLFSNLSFASPIKIRIAKGLKKVIISGIDMKVSRLKKPDKTYAGEKTLKINCSKLSGKKKKKIVVASFVSYANYLNWGRKKYKGKLYLTYSKWGGCDLINELPMEDYISSLLGKEMSPQWPLEALKAQAIAARSYAYYKRYRLEKERKKILFHLENSEKHQVNGSFCESTTKTDQATHETQKEILVLKKNEEKKHLSVPTPIFFHSKCGGKTKRPEQVWKKKVEGYRSVLCPFCKNHGKKPWKRDFTKSSFASYLSDAMKVFKKERLNKSKIHLTEDNRNNSYLRFYDEDKFKVLQKSRLRQITGRSKIPSNYYSIEEKGDKVQISGKGYGHGVGMCQFGVLELAKRGYNYKQILKYYFPQHRIVKIIK